MLKINIDEHKEKVVENLQKVLKDVALDTIELHNGEKEIIGHLVVATLTNGMVFSETNHETDREKAIQDAIIHINNKIYEMEYYRIAQNAADALESNEV